MKERPILFSAPMVRALLDGSKTQTRRICKPMQSWVDQACREVRNIDGAPFHFLKDAEEPLERLRCSHGQPGDRLWVRESFWGCDLPGYGDRPCVVYDDEWSGKEYEPSQERPWARKFGRIPSIHMPRDCSRILLEIVSVRVERLNDCSEADALAEGISTVRTHEWDAVHFPEWRRHFDEACAQGRKPPVGPMPSQTYAALWDEINGAGSWAENSWVWVIEFRRVTP